MWFLRLVLVACVFAVLAGVALAFFTGDRRYLLLAWRLFRYTLMFTLGVFALMVLERVAILPL
ncbi:MAG: hypothetical protein RIR00_879 [Pseudomonadota bacterium]|jgi:hypothetical protein